MTLVNRLLLFCLSCAFTSSVIAAPRPNVMFILTEDQGAHLSHLGTAGLQTPNMDRIAKAGVYFNNAFVAYPVCSASKAAIYTGLHSHTNGILNNTHNYHKHPEQLTSEELGRKLYKTNRVRPQYATLIEILKAHGYYQGVTHKLHVAPVEKFPYDEFLQGSKNDIKGFLDRAQKAGQPWFLMVNIPNSHRPYPNSDNVSIRVDPSQVQLPEYLPDTPLVRKDWAEYLAGVEQADAMTGQALDVLRESGQDDNTIVVFMSDHGPTFQHGKMTLYDLGLRVPLIVKGPGIQSGKNCDQLVSELDLFDTLLDLTSCPLTTRLGDQEIQSTRHGSSLKELLTTADGEGGHELIFAEISNRGPLPNDGMQERSVFDGRWKLIYRERVATRWRQVNADSRLPKPWGNRTYDETRRVKDQFPEPFRVLQEMDPQNLGGNVPRVELYDLDNDADEMQNLASHPGHQSHKNRLLSELAKWVDETKDSSVNPHAFLSSAANASSKSSKQNDSTTTASPHQRPSPFATATSKKGLQVEIPEDAIDLGVKHAVFNLSLPSLVSLEPSPSSPSWEYQGQRYYFNESYLRRRDAEIKKLSDRGVLVYLVVLAGQSRSTEKNRLILHPDYDTEAPNRIGAFNCVTQEGRNQFVATLQFLANRWSHSDSTNGKVVGYIIGNEVNSHWWWYNQGKVTLSEFTDSYVDTMRLACDAVGSQSEWARVYVSLDHHWTNRMAKSHPKQAFGSRPFLERFADIARRGGDFEWHVAFHPYPQSLFDPRFWRDSTAQLHFESPRVTFRNLEVLTAFMRQPAMRFGGATRSIILSEQGFHTPSGPDGENLQAAAYCYAYKKIESMEGIDAFILHRHVDHPREGGLRLGLRHYDDVKRKPGSKKRIYHCFQNADGPDWKAAFQFALGIVDLESWDDAKAKPLESGKL